MGSPATSKIAKIADWNKKVLKANSDSIYKGEQLGIKAVRQETDS